MRVQPFVFTINIRVKTTRLKFVYVKMSFYELYNLLTLLGDSFIKVSFILYAAISASYVPTIHRKFSKKFFWKDLCPVKLYGLRLVTK